MKKLETIIYIVGPKRSWEFQARHVKRIFLFILLVILGLGGTIGYQEYDHLQALKKADVKLDQENLKNEKLLALIARIREEGMKDNPSVTTTTDVDLSKQQKLNEQQSILIQQQRKELGDLKGVLTQRERVIQQFQLEKQSTKDQVINLQEKLRISQENFEQTNLEKQTTQQRVQEIEQELAEVRKSLEKLKQKNTAKKKLDKISTQSGSVINVSNLKIKRSASKIQVSFQINNQTKQRQSGRVGVYITSNENAKKPMPYSSGKTQSFGIRRFKSIVKELVDDKSGEQIRIIVWNSKRNTVLDEVFRIPN